MAIVVTRPVIGTSSTLIAQNTASGSLDDDSTLSFLLASNAVTVWLGPSGVTSSTGWAWLTTYGPFAVELEPGESLYGVVASGVQTLHVIRGGR